MVDKLKKLSRQKKDTEAEDFRGWLTSLGLLSVPTLHVNGTSHPMAVITVDFGTPLDEPTKLTTEQNAELMARMKTMTRTLCKSESNVRVQNDSSNGVWWSTIA